MENIIIKGQITATSKKNEGKFKQQTPTKTAYISTDEENAQKLEEFGATKYTSKEGDDYFILKFPANLMVYKPNGFGEKRPKLSQVTVDGVETNNFKTPDDKMLGLNVIKGENLGNTFFRLQAIRIEDETDIEEISPENPFGDKQAF